jgi:hypothetical protein
VKGTAGAAVVKRARLASAYERTLDYKVGVRGSASPQRDEFEQEEHDASMLGNPTMSAWGGIAEAKIQQAIRQGMLKHIKGRGKPIERDDAESNPFISRCVRSFLQFSTFFRRPFPIFLLTDADLCPLLSLSFPSSLVTSSSRREEFLMNRVLKQQEVAPPWVETQRGAVTPPLSLSSYHYTCLPTPVTHPPYSPH